MPAFYPVILVRFLVIYQGLDCDGVEVVGISIGGVVDSTRFRLFRVCCEGCRAEEEGEQGGGEDRAHCDLERERLELCQSGQGCKRPLLQLPVIKSHGFLWMEIVVLLRSTLQAVAELVLSELS